MILEGIIAQSGAFKTLTIQDNDIDINCVAQLTQLTKRRLPEQLDTLSLLDCRMAWQTTEKLVKDLNPNSLRTLCLVNVNLNEFSLGTVYSVVQKHKRLVNLDISSNHLAPRQMRSFLESVSKNRRLQQLSLGWNSVADQKMSEDQQQKVSALLGNLIKHNKNLIHIDLTACGLTNLMMKELGTHVRRSGSLLGIHLTGNPGLTAENTQYLSQRIRCRPVEDIERYTFVQNFVSELMRQQPHELKKAIIWRMRQNKTFHSKYSDPAQKFVL